MISPPSTPPNETPRTSSGATEPKVVKSTPIARSGQSPAARTIKAIVRPILKALYYSIQWIRRHGVVSIIAFVLLIASIFATSYYSTGALPFHIGQDQFNFNIHGTDGGGLSVKNWLYSLRDGDLPTLTLLSKDMNPQPSQQTLQGYISQFSQSQSHLQWTSITVLNAYEEPDTSIDSFVKVDLTASGPGGTTKGYLIVHFVTVSANGQELLIEATPITFRAPLQ
ncbi:MAG TPA: hypothetical protein DHW02_04030 [Ktedonobacter sp.]|nr:hypothetical protein [Ktedonobacter sp.]